MFLIPGYTAMQSLSLQYDGPRPPHLIRVAEAIDRETDVRRPAARIRVSSVRLRHDVAVRRMAVAMVDAFRRAHMVTRDDMRLAGFSELEIDMCATEARQLACLVEPRFSELTECH